MSQSPSEIDFGFITSAQYNTLTPDDRLLFHALEAKGYRCRALVWDDPQTDWQSVRVSLLRSVWDYHIQHDQFMKWLDSVSSQTLLINPAELVRENISKNYIENIAKRGFSVIPTIFLKQGQKASITSIMLEQSWSDIIIKPAVGLSSYGVKRVKNNRTSTSEAQNHLDSILQSGDVLVQPYFSAVEDYGERNLVFIASEFSHCVRKMRFQASEKIGEVKDTLVEPSEAELVLAKRIIDDLSPQPFYARVDLLRDGNQHPCLIELELIDPKLFFSLHKPSVESFVNKIVALLENS